MLSTSFSKSYSDLPFFSHFVKDFLTGNELIQPLKSYNHHSVEQIIEQRKQFPLLRDELSVILLGQYQGASVQSEATEHNIKLIQKDNTFTVCTAHQPHLALGPLYILYKTIHVILLARQLQHQHAMYNFVPVFFMGSEDADKGELLQLHLGKYALRYETVQRGAVGRMNTSDWTYFANQLSKLGPIDLPFWEQTYSLIHDAYQHPNMALSFRYILEALFSSYGLLVLDIDDVNIKKLCLPIFEQEIQERTSRPLLQETSSYIDKHYRTHQLDVSATNLFHLDDAVRQKITTLKDQYIHPLYQYPISNQEYIRIAHESPDCLSPNAVLRPVIQEYVLPNIAFIGGASEIAYWLQLKKIFDRFHVHYPDLHLRQSFMIVDKYQQTIMDKLDKNIEQLIDAYPIGVIHFFEDTLTKQQIDFTQLNKIKLDIKRYRQTLLKQGFQHREQLMAFERYVDQFYYKVEKKMIRQHNRLHNFQMLNQLYNELFPYNQLQERTTSWVDMYAKYGFLFIEHLLKQPINSTSKKLTVLSET